MTDMWRLEIRLPSCRCPRSSMRALMALLARHLRTPQVQSQISCIPRMARILREFRKAGLDRGRRLIRVGKWSHDPQAAVLI